MSGEFRGRCASPPRCGLLLGIVVSSSWGSHLIKCRHGTMEEAHLGTEMPWGCIQSGFRADCSGTGLGGGARGEEKGPRWVLISPWRCLSLTLPLHWGAALTVVCSHHLGWEKGQLRKHYGSPVASSNWPARGTRCPLHGCSRLFVLSLEVNTPC